MLKILIICETNERLNWCKDSIYQQIRLKRCGAHRYMGEDGNEYIFKTISLKNIKGETVDQVFYDKYALRPDITDYKYMSIWQCVNPCMPEEYKFQQIDY